MMAVLLFIIIFFTLLFSGAFGKMPSKDKLASIQNEEASLVYSKDGKLIGKYFAENRTNISWDKVPDYLAKALIATEDKRYYSHEGYDVYSYFRVFFKTILLRDKTGGGGSTLTQQLIKNIFGRNDYGFMSMPIIKVREAVIAHRLEEVYTKDEILLLYLNSIPFGENVYGVEAAALRFFNKSTDKLKIEEVATLVGMLKANSHYNPRMNPENSRKRRDVVLSLMEAEDYISKSELDSISNLDLVLDYENFNTNPPAAYFVYQVKKEANNILEDINIKEKKSYNIEKDGLKIKTTLDSRLQEIVNASIKKHLVEMQKLFDKELETRNFKSTWIKKYSKADISAKNKMDIAFADSIKTVEYNNIDSLWHYYKILSAPTLLVDPKNGNILSWSGGINYRFLPYDLIYSKRQIASAFKPILYSSAFENSFSECEYLNNEEVVYKGYEDWNPHNFDNNSTPHNKVAIWYALTNSMNLPSIDLYFKLGHDKLENTFNKFKINEHLKEVPSVALGSMDLSLNDIIKIYSAFANKGMLNDLKMIESIIDADGNIIYENEKNNAYRALSDSTSYKITALLENVVNEGTAKKIRYKYGINTDLAGKTGTAQDYTNAWFVAYTPNLVLGSWVGTGKNDIHFTSGNGSGSSLALPVIADVLKEIENDKQLSERYLGSFNLAEKYYSFKYCEPFKQLGLKGILSRTFETKTEEEKQKLKEVRQAKKEKRKEKRENKKEKIKDKFNGILNKEDKNDTVLKSGKTAEVDPRCAGVK